MALFRSMDCTINLLGGCTAEVFETHLPNMSLEKYTERRDGLCQENES